MITAKAISKYGLVWIVLCFLIACDDNSDENKALATANGEVIQLAGVWAVKLDSLNTGADENWFLNRFEGEEINLPGTLDDAGIGKKDTLTPALNNYVLSNLARKHSYIGKAWYQREIQVPENWSGKSFDLKLERVLWSSTVYIDSVKVGSRESLVGSHNYDLTAHLNPGRHLLTVEIDNSDLYPNINVTGDRYPLKVNQEMAHAYTNHTQIKWNGILGAMNITASSPNQLQNLQIYPDFDNDEIRVSYQQQNATVKPVLFELLDASGAVVFSKEIKSPEVDGPYFNFTVERPAELKFWDEFNPNVYMARITNDETSAQVNFGYRKIENKNAELHLNDHRIFLRGNLECVIFPLTGYPPMKTEAWKKLFEQAKNYGLNHIRFHSWCPPEAAFQAADEAGMYLQVELPHWSLKVGEDAKTTQFLKDEAQKILRDYGNHPSFVLMSMGNELQGDMQTLNDMTATLKKQDSRHLYATTSFSFQKPAGTRPEPEDEFFVAQWTQKGWIRGQGVFNNYPPGFENDYTANSKQIEVPLISHEIGQYSVYPDLSEIPKYTGVLEPLNFIAVKNDLEQKGLIDLAPDFTYASGKLAAMLYKEEIERALKTPAFDGFQLLQLQDFPGQGTALVGLLNAFWESKGVITGEEFREFNSPLVPLARFEKAVYEQGENFTAKIEVANFLEPKENQNLHIFLKDEKGTILKEMTLENLKLSLGNNPNLGTLSFPINVTEAAAWTLGIELEGTPYKNHWPIWVYPQEPELRETEVVETTSFTEAVALLEAGKTVLLSPQPNDINGVQGRFVPVFWSPVHFPDQPGTMGLLIDNQHKALANFPTASYTQWQWWDLCIQSKSVRLNGLQLKPIVRVVDNFVTNNDLANLFEAKVGAGRLIFSAMDIQSNLSKRPVARQLHASVLNYMASADFDPQQSLSKEDLVQLEVKN
ncbi:MULTISPECIES: sugar-binding domain-containing protein [unclassified Leeuwenhoekiella]|uniref:sugar-binding domain-containing protein n=1 Tax=unclassified Leeuwenhoekiella TaxID=2615029 RepID=UPI000C53D990|nr:MULTISPECIES: sugar-binding domain-containing protein [unclassified Leeuwenhoekiella]MAW94348.1 glycoside hydrolase family 2 [Leeuwenhoekiella sp.]MBA81024.1 glycoside hydrolase family 2 [Leeuwenhoekiella sp.]|tara:strand:- start:12282 stop:15080 length:2799 start_codon:yes stop_codon:yes gene_type:complete